MELALRSSEHFLNVGHERKAAAREELHAGPGFLDCLREGGPRVRAAGQGPQRPLQVLGRPGGRSFAQASAGGPPPRGRPPRQEEPPPRGALKRSPPLPPPPRALPLV